MKKIYSLVLGAFITPALIAQTCTPPTLTINPVSTCANATATITATTTANIVKWYDSASSTTPIFTGNTFVTPPITTSTNYWVEASDYQYGAQITGGKSTPSTSSSSVNSATAPWGLAFTVSSDFLLETVDVFASANGNLVLELLDANYAGITSRTIPITTGGTSTTPVQITIPVGFTVAAGNSYKLVARSSPSMRRDTGTNSFPFNLGGLGSITGGTINNSPTTNSGVYYFFYNWKVSPIITCTSPKVQTTVTIGNTTSTPVATSPQSFSAGATLADLIVNGQNIKWYSSSNLTTLLSSTTPLVSGTTYYVTQTINGCESAPIPVIVNQSLSTKEENLDHQLKVYPNPVSDVLNIESKSNIKRITLIDASGKNILMKEINNDNKIHLNISEYPKGKYILKLETEKLNKVIPFIKK